MPDRALDPDLAAVIRERRPGLEITVTELEPPIVFEQLDDGELDIVVAVDYRDAPSRHDARYLRRDLLHDPLDVVLPASHPLASESAARHGLRLERLADEVWVSSDPADSCAMITTAVCAGAGFSPDVRHHCQEWDSAAALVAAGAGVALIPRLAQPLRQQGGAAAAGRAEAHRRQPCSCQLPAVQVLHDQADVP